MLRVGTDCGRILATLLWTRPKSTSSRNLADALQGTGRLKVDASKLAKSAESKPSSASEGTRSVPRSEKSDDQRPSLQSLIDKFRTAASTNVKADAKMTTSGGGSGGAKQGVKKKAGSGPNNNGATDKKQGKPMSVRDSFRMKEEKRKSSNTKTRSPMNDGKDGKRRTNTNIQGGGGGARSRPNALSERAAKAASDTILHGLDSSLPGDDSMIEDDEMIPEMTEGEKRYMRYQERIKIDKQKFQRNIPSPTRAPNSSYRKGDGRKKQDEDVPVGIAEMRRRLHEDRLNRSQVFSGGMKKPPQNKSNNSLLDLPKKKKGPTTIVSDITISGHGISVRTLASKLSIRLDELKSKLFEMDVEIEPLTEAQKHDLGEGNYDDDDRMIDADIAELVALDLDIEVKREDVKGPESYRERDEIKDIDLVMSKRAPVVCVMGHVDHGKTTLLDTLRKASVAENEAGGITQKLSAFAVDLNTLMDDSDSITKEKKEVVFLDTPGHAAFSTMRSHGVCATDLVVLVIAIDDGVKAQTVEALRTAKEAGCTILVALNKCDRMPDDKERMQARARILSKLIEEDLTAEEFGGDVLVTEVAAATGQGVQELVANVFLQAELMELDAAVEGQCEATVLDANLEKGRGVVADILVRWGNLKIGDPIVVDTMFGRVKHLSNDRGQSIKEAGPSTPVRLLGLRTIPTAGQELLSVENEARARKITERRQKIQDLRNARKQVTENGSPSSIGESDFPALSLFLKADGVGTLEALQKIASDMDTRTNDVNVKVVGSGVGDITRTDVEQASTSNAAILGFNVRLSDSQTRATSRELDVSVNRENIIYRLEERLVELMQAQMPKQPVRTIEGSGVVQKIFTLNDKSKTSIAGLIVQSGNLKTSGSKGSDALMYKVLRESEIGMPMKIKKTTEENDQDNEDKSEENEDEEEIVINEDGCVFTEHYVNKDTAQLKRYKDIVHSVEQGADCGLSLSKFRDWKEGDVVECYRVEWETKKMSFIDQ